MRRTRRTRRFAKAAYAAAALLLMLAAPAAGAADNTRSIRTVELKFDEARSALVHSRLIGPNAHEYTFEARKGQLLALTFNSDWSQLVGIYLLPPGIDLPLYTNFIDGTTRWNGVAPGSGTYRVRLAFLRSQSKRSGLVDYDLEVKVTDREPRYAAKRQVRVAERIAAGH